MIRFPLSGVKVPHRKNTADMPAERMPAPQTVVIPMSQHIGAPCVPVVKAGDSVKIGQVIAEPGGYVGTYAHSGISGIVKKIEPVRLSNGSYSPAVFIESDGESSLCDGIAPVAVESYEDFIDAVRRSGAVGLGGAGFPTAVKLDVKDTSRINTIIINGAECEPYITSDTRTMLDDAELLCYGLELLHRFLNNDNIVFGIENNKKKCIRLIKEKTANMPFVEIKQLPSIYPQGGEKVLIHNITGKIVPEGKLPIDVGVIVLNCTTLAAIARYIKTGMPLVEKCITVDGSAIAEPKNVIAPIGTAVADVIEFCGGFKEEVGKVLYGGPMMGIAVDELSEPILKNNNAIIAFNKADSAAQKTTPCIRCGKCIKACPIRLNPVAITKAYKAGDVDALRKVKANLCMECGCCSFICPTKQPLVQRNKLAKAILREAQAKEATHE